MKFRVTPAAGADAHIGNTLEAYLAKAVGPAILHNMERIVPVGPEEGQVHLRDELHQEIDRDGAFVSLAVGSDKDYAAVVEVGRRDNPNYPIQPYMKPALYQTRGVKP